MMSCPGSELYVQLVGCRQNKGKKNANCSRCIFEKSHHRIMGSQMPRYCGGHLVKTLCFKDEEKETQEK